MGSLWWVTSASFCHAELIASLLIGYSWLRMVGVRVGVREVRRLIRGIRTRVYNGGLAGDGGKDLVWLWTNVWGLGCGGGPIQGMMSGSLGPSCDPNNPGGFWFLSHVISPAAYWLWLVKRLISLSHLAIPIAFVPWLVQHFRWLPFPTNLTKENVGKTLVRRTYVGSFLYIGSHGRSQTFNAKNHPKE